MIFGSNMKIAISMDDRLLHEADETARLMGLSRSRLFAVAIGDFLEKKRQEQMLLRLNDVYTIRVDPAEKRLTKSIKNKVGGTIKEPW